MHDLNTKFEADFNQRPSFWGYSDFFSVVGVGVCLGALPWITLTHSLPAWAKASPQTEIHVTLLGQPCLIEGPYDENTLRTIHGMGPAQLYPIISMDDLKASKESSKSALEKINSDPHLPLQLDRYKNKLSKRLMAQIDFLSSLENLEKNHELPKFLNLIKKYLKISDLKRVETILKKIKNLSKISPQYRDGIEQIFDSYNDGIEPDPEEEFHRAIKKLNVQYTCSFEESGEL